ncbi:hypothetical protein ACFV6F_05810 [Kitasatospora phosalacinea]|uniref:hypothetical protein n=1 Tax=Kitasatospora phosalacinea TaxID=2065 RepID=UPI003667C1BB
MLIDKDPAAATVNLSYTGFTPAAGAPTVRSYLKNATSITSATGGTTTTTTVPAYSVLVLQLRPGSGTPSPSPSAAPPAPPAPPDPGPAPWPTPRTNGRAD